MIKRLDGARYLDLVDGGIQNLIKHKTRLNELNVFPVPDGDTGTNMAMTLKYGFDGLGGERGEKLGEAAGAFATAAVFGARGNSGVISSQFFKGIAKAFADKDDCSIKEFAVALMQGFERAYRSVANPVEGTMLTVLRGGASAVESGEYESLEELVNAYLVAARVALDDTPNLLPVLKKAGVVDSGGSGIVCFFEGVQKRLNGEEIETGEDEIAVADAVDFSLFDKDTRFEYGYCMEGLLQLCCDETAFDAERFKDELSAVGGSVVVTQEGDKVKLHVHAKKPAKVFDLCQNFGEFLTVKIENMTVQNMQRGALKTETQKFLCAEEKTPFDFAVVAVAQNAFLQNRFFEMGADVALLSEIAPSSQDMLDAFDLAGAKNILVFPNSANSVMTCLQAAKLYKKANAIVLPSRSAAQCYAALTVLDFEQDAQSAADEAKRIFDGLFEVEVYRADKDFSYGDKQGKKGELFSLAGKNLLATGESLESVLIATAQKVLAKNEFCVATLFYGKDVPEEYAESLAEEIGNVQFGLEVAIVPTFDESAVAVIAFE